MRTVSSLVLAGCAIIATFHLIQLQFPPTPEREANVVLEGWTYTEQLFVGSSSCNFTFVFTLANLGYAGGVANIAFYELNERMRFVSYSLSPRYRVIYTETIERPVAVCLEGRTWTLVLETF